jgi:hypothetical protein
LLCHATACAGQTKALQRELEESMEANGEQKLVELRQHTAVNAVLFAMLHAIGIAEGVREVPSAGMHQTFEVLQT